MYHPTRTLHRWAGITASLFLILISATGFLLATKGTFGWIRPPEVAGAQIVHAHEIVPLSIAAEAAFALGIAELQDLNDIDRIDYRPDKNHFKIVSKRGYHEVQVDGRTGKVLQIAKRNDQLAEDIHDLSYFADWAHDYGLPAVAVLLFALGTTGIIIFTVPILRRARFRRNKAMGKIKQ